MHNSEGDVSDPLPQPPEGWYVDPGNSKQQRHWNGEEWTDQIAPLPPPQAPVQTPNSSARQGWGYPAAVLSALGVIAGSFAPWATSALESVPGSEVDGQVTGVMGLIALILVASRRLIVIAIVLGILGVVIGISDIGDVNNYSVEAFGTEVHPASVGWGLWMMTASSVALAVCGSRLRMERSSERLEERVNRELDDEEAVKTSAV